MAKFITHAIDILLVCYICENSLRENITTISFEMQKKKKMNLNLMNIGIVN